MLQDLIKNVLELATGLKKQSLDAIPTVVTFLIKFISICDDNEVVQSIVKSIQDSIGEIQEEPEEHQIVMLASLSDKVSNCSVQVHPFSITDCHFVEFAGILEI